MESYDYIIVGAGSAGCAVADRLARGGRHRVLVLEAGGRDTSPWLTLPLGYGRTFFDPRVNWKFETEPEASLGGRRGYWPRGKVLGGSSAINALVYVRGQPGDFDDWAAAGAHGWAWRDVAPVFDDMESRVAADGRRSGNGPVFVQDVSDQVHGVNRHFFAGAAALGLPGTEDCNGASFEGATTYRINTRNGARWSAARAFLRPARRRGNVTVRTGALVERLTFEDGRATGLQVRFGRRKRRFAVRREIILCAGSVGSPAILQRSGLGAEETLLSAGVTPKKALPEVGRNLQDHLGISYYFRATEATLNNQLAPFAGKLRATLRYALRRRGPLALSVNQCGGFFRSEADCPRPDQQLYFNPVTYTTTARGTRTVINPDSFAGFALGFQPTRPQSRGRIGIADADPATPPRIIPSSLSAPGDSDAVIAGGRLCRALLGTDAIGNLIEAPMGPDPRRLSDEALLEDFRDRSSTVFHPVGTCRIGTGPEDSVVDPALRVHGIDGLRVADASVFPSITSGNTNAPAMMVGYRAGNLILEAA